jgi:PBP1b-binding outer membrane lipoprotein LpoB
MNTRAFLVTAAILFMGGCAASTQPSPTPNVAAAPAAPAAPAAVAPAAGIPAALAPAPEPAAQVDSRRAHVNRIAAELGYHVETRSQQRFFCRTAASLGTRLAQKECMSEDTMTDAVRAIEQNRNSWQQPKVCQGKDCVVR